MPEHKGSTDKVTVVTLTSTLEVVMWDRQVASPGGSVGLEVFTANVGNGAALEIDLLDYSGKKHGTFSDKIAGNRFWATLLVPTAAKDALYAEVKLPKHGLTRKSAPVTLTQVKWDRDTARRAEVVQLSADIKGAPEGAVVEISIWEHDADGAHDLITRFPMKVKNRKVEASWVFEYHEDVDDLPVAGQEAGGYHAPSYFFRVDVGGVTEDSGLLGFKDWVEIELRDRAGGAIPNATFVLTLADGTEKRGTLNQAGKAVVEEVPPGRFTVDFPDLEEGAVERSK